MKLRIEKPTIRPRWKRISIRRGRPWLAAGMVALIGILGACTEEGQDALESVDSSALAEAAGSVREQLPEDTAPAEQATPEPTAPAETAAPAPADTAAPEAGEPETAPPDAVDDEALSTEDWILLIVLAVVAVAIFIAATNAASRRSEAKARAATDLQRSLSEIVGGCRWIHDSGSIEVLLATDPDQMQSAWNSVRSRMVNVEGQIATLAAGSGNDNLDHDLRYLGQCVADLRSAEEGYVTTKLRAPSDRTELTRTSDQAVSNRRQQLQAAIEPVAATMRS